ncbi:hypothetical protein [Thalassoglobus sp.]|uniref:hypothetical protein n=1 Tax=Thalassoglobus sp. TaxID=2795869 RepID=UPI003AA833E9
MGNSVLFNVIGSLIMIPIALILICTLILAKLGAQLLWAILQSFFTGEVFRDQRKLLLQDEARIRPLILGAIILGPHGHGLVLGTFLRKSQQETTLLGLKAMEFASLYKSDTPSAEDKEMFEMLRQDAYIPGRRRVVPESHSGGHELVLFDIELDPEKAIVTDRKFGWVAAVTTLDPEKEVEDQRDAIIQIPWDVVADAVSGEEIE